MRIERVSLSEHVREDKGLDTSGFKMLVRQQAGELYKDRHSENYALWNNGRAIIFDVDEENNATVVTAYPAQVRKFRYGRRWQEVDT